ncbi:MAG: DUF4249 domain-containing protein [Bacteroidia bacterium]|nr:DUF4249 domain-containing protein [Bacteroidia bacterium]
MKNIQQIILFSFLLLLNSCIVQFIPETDEDKELLVVEGLITDQPGANTVKLSKSLPLGRKYVAKPLKGCIVKISDDLGNTYSLKETVAGTYVTDPAKFQGIIGRWYTLHINTNIAYNNLNYESFPMELRPVPPIDSIYYEKKIIKEKDVGSQAVEGCQIYLNTHDPANYCKFYRWEYSETWEFRLPYTPYTVPNNVCWISNNSDRINIKSTSVLEEDRINRYPLNFISNMTDRLNVKYSILVNQYSLNEDEYLYWEKLQNISEQVGGLYDIIPAAIPSNIWCIEDLNEKVLGYFSVSASSSKRIFIKDHFSGLINLYTDCPADTIVGSGPIPNLNISVWVIIDNPLPPPPTRVITYNKGCADCSVRGTTKKPIFWGDDK